MPDKVAAAGEDAGVTKPTGPGMIDHARSRSPVLVERLRTLVECESPSDDPAALRACADLIADFFVETLGRAPQRTEHGHLLWRGPGEPRVLLLGHYDTVWPVGTLAGWPFTVGGGTDGGTARGTAHGPGVLDMKAGIVQLLAALDILGDPAGVSVLLTADEEVGSPTSRSLVEAEARRAGCVLVCEPGGPAGQVKKARRGTAVYRLSVTGRAAHAGEAPEDGVNAAVELAAQIPAIAALADRVADTTVTPTVLRAGTATNCVPESGYIDIDVRAWTPEEQARIDSALRALEPRLPGARLAVSGGVSGGVGRPPFEAEAAQPLVGLLYAAAGDVALPPPEMVRWRSASDANLTAALGIPTLDGLGAVGAFPHARSEYIDLPTMPDRAALLAALINRIRNSDPDGAAPV
jgi:glutamate carboxypeptidase